MSRNGKAGAGLSRALLVGATLGTIPLVQVGCAPQQTATPAPQQTALPAQGLAATTAAEEELCRRALATRAVSDAEALIRSYPAGRCVAPTLTALPPATLAQISPAVLRSIPPEVRATLPSSVAGHLRVGSDIRGAAPPAQPQPTGVSS